MINSILTYLFSLSRKTKILLQVLVDLILIFISFLISMFLRLDHLLFLKNTDFWNCLIVLMCFNLIIFFKLNLYKNIIRFVTSKILYVIFISSALSGLFVLIYSQAFNYFLPRSVPFIFSILFFLSTSGVRLFFRNIYLYKSYSSKINVGIVGINDQAIQFLNIINQNYNYKPICFFDYNKDYLNAKIGGLNVRDINDLSSIIITHNLKIVYISSSEMTVFVKKILSTQLTKNPIIIKTIPNFENYLNSSNVLENTKSISIETLLGRLPVSPKKKLMEMNITSKVVMVTGAGGSIGYNICKQILIYKPKIIILIDNNEYALFKIYETLKSKKIINKYRTYLIPLICSIQDIKKMEQIFKKYSIDTIYHAAAYKHVPLVEMNVIEAIKNNIFGTQNLINLTLKFNVKSFTLISSDKAVRPTSVMGVTKRFAELICQSSSFNNKTNIITIVRFGNVLGSSGSVIPIFKKQIERGGPVTLTDERITRYFMTIDEAAQLVIQSSSLSKTGNTFVLNMGKEIKIIDLAKQMIRLQGHNPIYKNEQKSNILKNIQIIETGLRPGEKLYEELFIGNKPLQTKHPRILTIREKEIDQKKLEKILKKLKIYTKNDDITKIYYLFNNSKIDLFNKLQHHDIMTK